MVAEVESTLTAIKDSYGADEIIGTYTFFKEAIQDRSDVPSYARDYVAKQLESNNFIEQALSSYDEATPGNLTSGGYPGEESISSFVSNLSHEDSAVVLPDDRSFDWSSKLPAGTDVNSLVQSLNDAVDNETLSVSRYVEASNTIKDSVIPPLFSGALTENSGSFC
jgi:hypothetical protein